VELQAETLQPLKMLKEMLSKMEKQGLVRRRSRRAGGRTAIVSS